MHLDGEVVAALEKAAAEAEKARQKGAVRKHKSDRTPQTTADTRNAAVSDAGTSSA
jgi:hypothetical protein